MNPSKPTVQELDLAIPDMHSPQDEARAAAILNKLPGVNAVRLVSRGAWIAYRAAIISRDQICHSLRDAGFRAATFQDSASGHTGLSASA